MAAKRVKKMASVVGYHLVSRAGSDIKDRLSHGVELNNRLSLGSLELKIQ